MAKHVIVTAEFVNLTPAHKRHITKQGEGSTVSVAVGRAFDQIMRDERVKGRRVTFPIKIVVQDMKGGGEE